MCWGVDEVERVLEKLKCEEVLESDDVLFAWNGSVRVYVGREGEILNR